MQGDLALIQHTRLKALWPEGFAHRTQVIKVTQGERTSQNCDSLA